MLMFLLVSGGVLVSVCVLLTRRLILTSIHCELCQCFRCRKIEKKLKQREKDTKKRRRRRILFDSLWFKIISYTLTQNAMRCYDDAEDDHVIKWNEPLARNHLHFLLFFATIYRYDERSHILPIFSSKKKHWNQPLKSFIAGHNS